MNGDGVAAPEWAARQRDLIRQMDLWTREAMDREARIPWLGTTDESTFMMSWIPHYFLTGREDLKQFMFGMRDRWQVWACEHLRHGFFASDAEEHHHTEDYKRFLGRLWYLDPYDERNTRPLEHFAHHLGNWVSGVPAWYDWKRHMFVSRFVGTRFVSDLPEHCYDSPGFFRYMLVAVLVHLMTGEGRYLALAMDYTDAWVRRIEQLPEGAPLPAGFDRSGRVLDRVSHLNEWLIGGILSVLLDLHLITQESRYAEAARRVLARLVGDQGNMVEAYGCTTTSLASYRLITGDRSLDRRVLDLAETMKEDGPPLALTGQGFAPHQRLEWQFESASGPAHPYSGPLLCLAYQITGDPPYAARALGCSAQMLEMARSLGDEGRAHGCASGHTNGVVLARVLTVLYPLTMGMVGLAARGTGHHKPLALYRDAGGRPGLPDGVAALFDFKGSEGQPPGAWRVTLANTTDEPRTVRVVGLDGLMRRRVNGLPWVVARQGMEPSRATVHPWEEVTGISVKLAPGETRAVHLPMPPE